MAIITYPLNGIDYDAENAETYLCTRTSGVYSADGNFQASVTGDRQVSISAGLAWIQNTKFAGKSVCNTESVAVEIPLADGTRPRIDRIVLRFDKSANASSIALKQGTPSSAPAAPAVERTELVYELGLCTVQVPAASTIVSAGNVTSTLLDESVCGLMRDGVTGIPTEQLQEQVTALLSDLRVAFEKQLDLQEQDFNEWFETIKGKLGDDPATALQSQVDDLQAAVGGMPLELSVGTNSIQIVADENRVGNVEVNGFTKQSGSGDASPENVREIENAGRSLKLATFDGSASWGLSSSVTGRIFLYLADAKTDQFGDILCDSYKPTNDVGESQPDYTCYISVSGNFTIKDPRFTDLETAKEILNDSPVTLGYQTIDGADATGIYTGLEVEQGENYRCNIIALQSLLHEGDTLETNVQSEYDAYAEFDGSSDENWLLDSGNTSGADGSKRMWIKLTGPQTENTSEKAVPVAASNQLTAQSAETTYIAKAANCFDVVYSGAINMLHVRIAGISTVEALKTHLQSHPLRVFYKSASTGAPKSIKREKHVKKTYVFTGNEEFRLNSEGTYPYFSFVSGFNFTSKIKLVCSHFPVVSIIASNNNKGIDGFDGVVYIRWDGIDTVEQLKDLLSQQYAADTPCVIEYELAAPEVFADEPVQLENPKGSSTVSSEDGTTVSVGLAGLVSENNLKSANTYSTEEVNTGKTWIDGKPIYRKSYAVAAFPNKGFVNVPLNISNLGQVVDYYGIASDGTNTIRVPYYSVDGDRYGIQMSVSENSTLVLKTNESGNRSDYSGTVTVEYTKS